MSVDPEAGKHLWAMEEIAGNLLTNNRGAANLLREAIDFLSRAATSSAGDLAATLEAVLAEHDADRADEAANAVDQGERPDLWEDEITIATHLIREAAQALRYQSTGVTDADVVRTGDAIAKAFHAEHGEWLSQYTRSELARAALSAQERG